MRKSILPLITLASVIGFGTLAQAHEPNHSPTGVERPAATRATTAERHHHAEHSLAYAAQPHAGGFAGATPEAPGLSPSDALLFELGDRGLGGN